MACEISFYQRRVGESDARALLSLVPTPSLLTISLHPSIHAFATLKIALKPPAKQSPGLSLSFPAPSSEFATVIRFISNKFDRRPRAAPSRSLRAKKKVSILFFSSFFPLQAQGERAGVWHQGRPLFATARNRVGTARVLLSFPSHREH